MKKLPRYVEAPHIGKAYTVGWRCTPSGEQLVALVPKGKSMRDLLYASIDILKALKRGQYYATAS
jgi:hypothetical protein